MARNPKKVFIGMAIGSGQEGTTRWETSMALVRLLCSGVKDYEFYVCPGGGCDIAHARNLMNHEWATRTDCGIAIHIDSDVVPQNAHLFQLLDWFQRFPDVQICAGLYPLKGMALRWSYGLWAKDSTVHPGLWEVGEVCGGFVAYRYELWEQLVTAHPESEYMIEDSKYRGETGHEIYAMGPIAARDWNNDGKPYRRRMPEDFMFSLRTRELGHTIYVDPTIQCGHIWNGFDCLQLHPKGKLELASGRE